MPSDTRSIFRVACQGCVIDMRAKVRARMVTVVMAALMASMVAETAVGRDSLDVTRRCTPGDHSMRRSYHDMCHRAHLPLGRREATVRKGLRSAAVTRPYDFPNSYVLHGPRF